MAKYKFKNPETGGVGEIPADHVAEAVRDGMVPVDQIKLYNPETKASGSVAPEMLGSALQDGLLVEDSTAHRSDSMSGLEAGARKVGQGLTMGFADEIAGGVKSLFNDKSYAENRDEFREGDAAASEKLGGWGTALEVAGGLAPALVNPGALLKAGGKEAIVRSAKQGAVNALGLSEADLTKGEFGQAALDTGIGAAVGGVAEAVLPRLAGSASKGVKRAWSKLKTTAADHVDPLVQRALASGATSKDFKGPLRDKLFKDIEIVNELGVFKPGELDSVLPDAELGAKVAFRPGDGLYPDQRAIQHRIDKQLAPVVGKQIGELYEEAAALGVRPDIVGAVVPGSEEQLMALLEKSKDAADYRKRMNTWLTKHVLQDQELAKIINNADPSSVIEARDAAVEWTRRMIENRGNVEKLLEIKQSLAKPSAFNKVPGQMSEKSKVAQLLYGRLNDSLKSALDEVAEESGNATLSKLNQQYSALANISGLLENGIAKEMTENSTLGAIKRSTAGGFAGTSAGAAIGSTFGPVGAVIGGAAGGVAGTSISNYVASTEGRLARAAAGERLTKAMGKLPRTTSALRQWITQNPDAAIPMFGAELVKLAETLPESVWQQQARELMPILNEQGLFPKSKYPTELDGRVAGPDKLAATNDLKTLNLPRSAHSLRQNELNKTGQLPPELMPKSQEEYLEQLSPAGFMQNLEGLGY